MKKIFLGVLLIVMFASYTWAMSGLNSDVLNKSKVVELNGKVVQLGIQNQGWMHKGGLVIQTSKEKIDVYGIGPMSFWKAKGLNYPKAGDKISVKAYRINIDGENYYIAKAIKLSNGKLLNLRDEKGDTLWQKTMPKRMMMHQDGKMMNGNKCPHMMNNSSDK